MRSVTFWGKFTSGRELQAPSNGSCIILEANVSIVSDHLPDFSQTQVYCIPGEEDHLEDSVLAQNKINGFLKRWVLRGQCKIRPVHSHCNVMRVCCLV